MRNSESLRSLHDLRSAARDAGEQACKEKMRQILSVDGWCGKASWVCPQCGVSLDFSQGYSYHHVLTKGCRCGQEAGQQAEAAFTREHWTDVVDVLWDDASIPRRFSGAAFSTFKKREGATAALATCQQYVKDFELGTTSLGLLFAGGFGAGKTHLVVATARALIEKCLVGVYFTTTGALFERLKTSDFDWSEVERATNAEVLILDDLAQDWLSTYDRGILFNLVNDRYERMKPTFFTTNAGAKTLEEMLGGALYSRLCEMADLVRLTASDYRRRSA